MLVNVESLAGELGLSRATIYRMVKAAEITPARSRRKHDGRRVKLLFDLDQVRRDLGEGLRCRV